MVGWKPYRVMAVGTLCCAVSLAQPQAAEVPAAPGPNTIRVLVVADQESVLASQMAGRIDTLDAQLGNSIKAGQVLLRFNCDEQQAQLKMADAEFYGVQQAYESTAKLQAMQSASELDVHQAAAAAQRAKAQIELYQAQIKQCTVRAPFSGRVTKLRAKRFESVAIGQPLIDVVNDGKLKVQLNAPSNWLAWIKVSEPFSIRIDETGKSYEGRVARINGRVDPVSQSIEIEGEVVGNPSQLLPGMSGVAHFAQAKK